MKKETQYEKSLRLVNEYLAETPKEDIEALKNKYATMKFEGPTINEYFDILQKELQKFMKQF